MGVLDYLNPNVVGRGLGSYAGRAIGRNLGGQEGADIGDQIGGHLGAGAGALMRGENAGEVAKQSFAPISPYIGSQLGQYVGNKFGQHAGSVGSQFGNQLGLGASALMYGKDPYQVARQTALGMLPGVANALMGPGASQQQAPQMGQYPVAQPSAQGYAHGGHVEPHYAMGGYPAGFHPMDVYNRMSASRSMQPMSHQNSYAHGGYAYGGQSFPTRPNLREMVELMHSPNNSGSMY